MRSWTALIAFSMALAVLPAFAHHSISSAYDSGREMRIEGAITEFHFVYPHLFVMIGLPDGARWMLEMDNRSELARAGMTIHTLKPGDRIVVTGNPARGGRSSLYVRKLERPADGFQYEQVGRSPRIRAGR